MFVFCACHAINAINAINAIPFSFVYPISYFVGFLYQLTLNTLIIAALTKFKSKSKFKFKLKTNKLLQSTNKKNKHSKRKKELK